MKLTIDSNQLEEILYGLKQTVSEGLIRLTDDKLHFKTADPATVAMIDLEIPEDSFEKFNPAIEEHDSYQNDGEDGILIGINVDNLYTVSKHFNDKVNLSLDNNSQFVLSEGDTRFELPVLNLSTEDIPDTNELEFNSAGEMDIDQFKDLVSKLGVAGESCVFEFDPESGELEVKSESGQVNVETSFDLDEAEELQEGQSRSRFALPYVKQAQKAFKKLDSCEGITIKMGENFPMEMRHESDRENFEFVLAPRIEE